MTRSDMLIDADRVDRASAQQGSGEEDVGSGPVVYPSLRDTGCGRELSWIEGRGRVGWAGAAVHACLDG